MELVKPVIAVESARDGRGARRIRQVDHLKATAAAAAAPSFYCMSNNCSSADAGTTPGVVVKKPATRGAKGKRGRDHDGPERQPVEPAETEWEQEQVIAADAQELREQRAEREKMKRAAG